MRRPGSVLLAAVALTLAACGASSGPDAAPGADVAAVLAAAAAAPDVEAELLRRAVDEGPVVLYASGELEVAEGWIAAFRAAYPDVDADYVYIPRTSDLIARLQAEAATGARTADVVYSTTLAAIRDLLAVHHGAIVPDGHPAAAVSRDAVLIRLDPLGVAWNTDLVPAGFDPRGWEDFLDPAQSGCTHTAPSAWILSMLDGAPEVDLDEWFDGFRANGGVMSESLGAQVRRLASGEISCSATVAIGDVVEAAAAGAPVTFRALDPTPVVTQGVSVLTSSASPHAAALLARWLAGPEAAVIVHRTSGGISLTPGGPVAPGLEAWDDPSGPAWRTTTLLDLDRTEELADTVLDLIARHHTPFVAG